MRPAESRKRCLLCMLARLPKDVRGYPAVVAEEFRVDLVASPAAMPRLRAYSGFVELSN